jgi:arabinogalactan endo-1,4-beta-galactosidase
MKHPQLPFVIDKLASETVRDLLIWNNAQDKSDKELSQLLREGGAESYSTLYYTKSRANQLICIAEGSNQNFFLIISDRSNKRTAFYQIDGASFYRLQFAITNKNAVGDQLLNDFLNF